MQFPSLAMLEDYKEKRDFDRTPEPETSARRADYGALRFVVQKHAARRLHYDLRLEVDGVLKSWPVPKGPSLDPEEKRLAVLVEDHPLDYAAFEGVIPKGDYGAGHVIVWDAGIYSPDEGGRLSFGDRREAEERARLEIEAGKLSFTLRGRKLKGSWTLVRTRRGDDEWLLIKHKDGHSDASRDVLQDAKSVQSGLTIADLKAGRLPEPARWTPSGEMLEPVGTAAAFPSALKPMMARISDRPFSHTDWLFEPKLDGFRALALLRQGEVTLRSRSGKDMTKSFPGVADELSAQPMEELVLDGEIVALNDTGLPDFGLLQQSQDLPRKIKPAQPEGQSIIIYYCFDLLYANGRDLRPLPLSERKALLGQLLVPGEAVQVVEWIEGKGESFFDASVGMGLEGVVAKRTDSAYQAGVRSPSWLKIKHVLSQEFVVGGYTEGSGARSDTFGALMLGYHEGDKLRYAGRVGSGFDQRTLAGLRESLEVLRADQSPFGGETDVAEDVTWTRPELVAQVKFSEWTPDDHLRAPVYLGLRPELDPAAVVREEAETGISPGQDGSSPEEPPDQSQVGDVLDQLSGKKERLILEVGGHRISLTNLNKEFWPAEQKRGPITKRDMIRYYARMGPVLVPHLRDRPLTLTRYPNGIAGESFYQKRWEHDIPEFVETMRFYSSHNEADVEYITVNNLATLVWLAQLADIEMQPWLSRTAQAPDASNLSTTFTGSEEQVESSVLNYPDFIVFDLDPYIYSGKEKAGDEPELNRRAFAKATEIALELKAVLEELSLSTFLKTSGKTGLHIYVPVLRQYDFGATRKTCELVGRFLVQRRPQDVTMEWSVSKRSGKIFLDHNQNVRGKNMASIYSLRPLPGAPVSTPLAWDELEGAYPTDFNIDTLPERVDSQGDLWAGVPDAKHDLSRLLSTAQ